MRPPSRLGAIAQLGERYTGSVEVGGSIPPSSTSFKIGTDWTEKSGTNRLVKVKEKVH